jgi:hypothetical protein
MGTGITIERKKGDYLKNAGGQLFIVNPDGPCMLCANLLDLKEASEDLLSTKEYKIKQERGYVSGMDLHSPSVVSLNGVIASLAMTEFIMLVTSLRTAKTLVSYDMLEGRESSVVLRELRKNTQCIHNIYKGCGDKFNVERYCKST